MSGIAIRVMGGVKPQVDPHLLDPALAQLAIGTRGKSGAISPWRKALSINTPTKVGTKLSIYRIPYSGTDYWLHWTTDVDMVKGTIANDAFNRYYYTGDSEPRVTTDQLATQGGGTNYPLAFYTLGLPAPAAATISSITGGSGVNQTRSYFVTLVSAWGEEGPPSLPVTSTGKVDATWNLASLPTAQPGGGTFQVATKNIYRTVLASDGTSAILFVANVALASSTYADSALDSALVGGTVLPSTTWIMPPSNLSGLIALPNGCLAGFHNNELCLSVPFQPHAWPIANRYSVDFPIVGIKANGYTIAVCTTANPYIFQGQNPDSMTPTKSKAIEPCLSKRGIVDAGWAVVYPSPNGLANALSDGSDGLQVITMGSILPNNWREQYFPKTMFGALYQEMYHGFYADGIGGGGGIVWAQDSATRGFSQANDLPTASWLDPSTGLLYMVVNGVIVQWDADMSNQVSATWKSKIFIEQKPMNYGALQVDANYSIFGNFAQQQAQLAIDQAYNATVAANATRGPLGSMMLGEGMLGGSALHGAGTGFLNQYFVTAFVYADGILKFQKNMQSRSAVKLPSGFKSDRWEIQIGANVDVYAVKMSENTRALERL